MSDIKSRVQSMDPNVRARSLNDFLGRTPTIYESLVIIAKRAEKLSVDLKKELQSKLEDFAVTSDTIEEIQENKEQIEISKFYERLPNPVIIATEEFLKGDLEHEYKEPISVIPEQ
jgi:DNA-directed RNA polymerase subunit K/omega